MCHRSGSINSGRANLMCDRAVNLTRKGGIYVACTHFDDVSIAAKMARIE